MHTSKRIIAKSPVAVLGTKHLLNYSRDHSVAEGQSILYQLYSSIKLNEVISRTQA